MEKTVWVIEDLKGNYWHPTYGFRGIVFAKHFTEEEAREMAKGLATKHNHPTAIKQIFLP